MSAFHTWLPHLLDTPTRELEFILSRGDSDCVGSGTTDFVQTLIDEIGIEVRVVDWSTRPYRTKYFSDYLDSNVWSDIWQPVWKVVATTSQSLAELPLFDDILFNNEDAVDESYSSDNKAKTNPAGCLVISAFNTLASLEKAKAAIHSNVELHALQATYAFEKPIFTIFQVLPDFYHLQIDLGTFPDDFFAGGADYAELVETICKQHGGLVHQHDLL